MAQAVLIVNTNIARPPVSPVGLEYVGQSLIDAGVPLQVLDLSFEPDWKASLQKELKNNEVLMVGVSVRNTDDCSFATRKSFIPWISNVVSELRKYTEAPVFLGGVGFSTMPEPVLSATQADGGIEGDGEEAVLALVKYLIKGEDWSHLPNMVYWHNGEVVRNYRIDTDLRYLPTSRRRIFDNRQYEQLGAMVGIETKRGCSQGCIFCADPVAKGRMVRLRPLQIVVQEIQDLIEQGVSWLHLCDSEFNLPPEHAKDVCKVIIEKGLANRIRWYCYCLPIMFDGELAQLMKIAGCAGVNFGVDSLCDDQLIRLGRTHTSSDIYQLVHHLHKQELNYMFDLLMGGPGETAETIRITIDKARELNIPLVGIAAGVRVYPDTLLGKRIADGSIKERLYPDTREGSEQPLFYLSPSLDDDVAAMINRLVDKDPRFLFLSAPSEDRSYNYADDEALSQLIKQGARGAYWDIIKQHRRV